MLTITPPSPAPILDNDERRDDDDDDDDDERQTDEPNV